MEPLMLRRMFVFVLCIGIAACSGGLYDFHLKSTSIIYRLPKTPRFKFVPRINFNFTMAADAFLRYFVDLAD